MTTFQEFCKRCEATKGEREKLMWYLVMIRVRKLIEALEGK